MRFYFRKLDFDLRKLRKVEGIDFGALLKLQKLAFESGEANMIEEVLRQDEIFLQKR